MKAGPQRVAAAFIQGFEAPVDDLMAPIDHTLADTQIGVGFGVTTLPHLRELRDRRAVRGHGRVRHAEPPHDLHLPSDVAAEESAVRRPRSSRALATQAYRGVRLDGAADVDGLMAVLRRSGASGRRDFEGGMRMALQAMLASPHFVFRFEQAPADGASRGRATASATSISRRGCRSSCGARFPTRSC